jgi:hypothetical protein
MQNQNQLLNNSSGTTFYVLHCKSFKNNFEEMFFIATNLSHNFEEA